MLDRYLKGDRNAISELIEVYNRKVYDYIRMLVKDEDLASDLCQETFIKAVRVIDDGKYTDNGKFLSWILRIAHNQVIDHFRSVKQNRAINESTAGFDIFSTIRLTESNAEDAIIRTQNIEDIKLMISRLPDEQKEVVIMRYYDDLSFKEIAEHTGVSINTALGRMRYALINLRKMLKAKELQFS